MASVRSAERAGGFIGVFSAMRGRCAGIASRSINRIITISGKEEFL